MRGRILVLVGSRTPQTAEQVRKLLQSAGAERFPAPDGVVAVEALAKSRADMLVIQATAEGGATQTDSEEVARRLGEGAAALLARGDFAALIVTGGDTAVALLQRLQQPALRVMGTLLPGIPYSKVSGPQGDIVVVTKSGGFGAPDSFHTIASRLRSSDA